MCLKRKTNGGVQHGRGKGNANGGEQHGRRKQIRLMRVKRTVSGRCTASHKMCARSSQQGSGYIIQKREVLTGV